MYKVIKLMIAVSALILLAHAQGFQGPASGKVNGGITLSTDDFSIATLPENVLPPSKGKKKNDDVNFFFSEDELNLGIFKEHKKHYKTPRRNSMTLKEELNFEGPNAFNCWVPDCNITPGPVDMLIAINTTFWITDREGNLKKQIDVNNWYSDFTGDGSGLVFDPKSFYDTRTKRFYMMYLYFDRDEQNNLFMVSVSDDSTAEGDWNNWALPADLNGTEQTEVWADFPSMVVTENALHIAVDMLPYDNPDPSYSKLRAFPLDDLLQETPGELNYTDIWDFRYPSLSSTTKRTLKLVHDYDETGNIYLTGFHVNSQPQTSINIFEVKNIFGNTQVNGIAVATSTFQLTPHMDQKGSGKKMQLFHLFYSEMFRRHGNIYIAHASRDGDFASIHYMKVNTSTWKLDEEIFLGKEDYYYGYPDLIVDEAKNVFMVYQRTSVDEYPGVYYSAKSDQAENFGEDITLMEGKGDMTNIGCGQTLTYIRFCDYTDIMFDPVEKDKIWLMGEYIGSDNRWKTRVAKVSVDDLVSVDDKAVKNKFQLDQNYPNPFNPSTKISFSIPYQSIVSIKIFNSLGQEVSTLVEDIISTGNHTFKFNAENLPSGIYFYEMRSDNYVETKKMVLLK